MSIKLQEMSANSKSCDIAHSAEDIFCLSWGKQLFLKCFGSQLMEAAKVVCED